MMSENRKRKENKEGVVGENVVIKLSRSLAVPMSEYFLTSFSHHFWFTDWKKSKYVLVVPCVKIGKACQKNEKSYGCEERRSKSMLGRGNSAFSSLFISYYLLGRSKAAPPLCWSAVLLTNSSLLLLLNSCPGLIEHGERPDNFL